MKAPEKIYLQACGSCELKDACENCEFAKLLNSGEVTWSEDKIYKTDIEYTRTDAFIEKTCAFLETYPHMFMGVLRSDMIEDFKKYMEE